LWLRKHSAEGRGLPRRRRLLESCHVQRHWYYLVPFKGVRQLGASSELNKGVAHLSPGALTFSIITVTSPLEGILGTPLASPPTCPQQMLRERQMTGGREPPTLQGRSRGGDDGEQPSCAGGQFGVRVHLVTKETSLRGQCG
jgi:hypothetical protein